MFLKSMDFTTRKSVQIQYRNAAKTVMSMSIDESNKNRFMKMMDRKKEPNPLNSTKFNQIGRLSMQVDAKK
jgi:hypothetical protein